MPTTTPNSPNVHPDQQPERLLTALGLLVMLGSLTICVMLAVNLSGDSERSSLNQPLLFLLSIFATAALTVAWIIVMVSKPKWLPEWFLATPTAAPTSDMTGQAEEDKRELKRWFTDILFASPFLIFAYLKWPLVERFIANTTERIDTSDNPAVIFWSTVLLHAPTVWGGLLIVLILAIISRKILGPVLIRAQLRTPRPTTSMSDQQRSDSLRSYVFHGLWTAYFFISVYYTGTLFNI